MNDEPLEIVEVEEQKAAPQQSQVTSQPETIAIDGGDENESMAPESSTHHHKYPRLGDRGTPAPGSVGNCARTDVKIQRLELATNMASIFNSMVCIF